MNLIGRERAEQIERVVEVDVPVVGEPRRAPAIARFFELGRRLTACGHDRVPREIRIAAIQVLDQLLHLALAVVVALELEHEEAIRRRHDRLVVVFGGRLLERRVVDDDLALHDQRAQLGVEVPPHVGDLLEAGFDQRAEPRLQRRDLQLVLVPRLEIEAALDLCGRRELDQRLRVFEADLVDELEHLVRRQRGDRACRVVRGEQRVDPAVTARARELRAKSRERTRRWELVFSHYNVQHA